MHSSRLAKSQIVDSDRAPATFEWRRDAIFLHTVANVSGEARFVLTGCAEKGASRKLAVRTSCDGWATTGMWMKSSFESTANSGICGAPWIRTAT